MKGIRAGEVGIAGRSGGESWLLGKIGDPGLGVSWPKIQARLDGEHEVGVPFGYAFS
jgi:hypothetical protein